MLHLPLCFEFAVLGVGLVVHMRKGSFPPEPQPCLEVWAFREILSKSQQFALKQNLSIYPHMRWCFYYCAIYLFLLFTYLYLVIYFLL